MMKGQICLVTGASRGIGRGIALQLGEVGATVYITGRQPQHSDAAKDAALPSLEKTAEEIRDRGGVAVAVFCDHGKPEEVKALFARIQKETDGRLDVLVNNAYAAVGVLAENWGKKFWETDPLLWDDVNNVGLRNHYVCSVYASRMMVAQGSGLIVNVSSAGGLKYIFNVAYGVGKAALDRMAADMAVELRPHGVAVVSLWPGAVQTEMFGGLMEKMFKEADDKGGNGITTADMAEAVREGESVEYSGKAVVALAGDPQGALDRSGRVLITADLGDDYGFLDVNGRRPPNYRSLKMALKFYKWDRLSQWIPAGIKVPPSLLAVSTHKF